MLITAKRRFSPRLLSQYSSSILLKRRSFCLFNTLSQRQWLTFSPPRQQSNVQNKWNISLDTQQLRHNSSSSSFPKHQIIDMPSLSPTMTQGNVGNWKKKVGDKVQPGDVLVEIETDKAQMELECQDEGYLAKILLEEGTKEALVGRPLAILVDKKEDVEKFKNFKLDEKEETTAAANNPVIVDDKKPNRHDEQDKPDKEPTTSTNNNTNTNKVEESSKEKGRIFASPLAKNIAKEGDIDLANVKGTGPNGRIVKADLPSSTANRSPFIDIPLTNMRKIIAQRLSESKSSIPHYYLTVDMIMDNLISIREKLNAHAKGDFRLSVNDFLIKAAGRALEDVPQVNSSWHGTFIRQYNNADISVAVATESGLVTPIIKQANAKGLTEISKEMKNLAERAKINKLKPEEFQGGSFTISNLGMFGIKHFTAVINPPQSCILAVGATEKRPVAAGEGEDNYVSNIPVIKSVMTVTMSCDHRVVDGATGAKWLYQFKKYIEDPITILL